MAVPDAEFRALREKVEVLNGDRGDKDRSQAALRRAQLAEVQQFVATLKKSAEELRKTLEGVASELAISQGDILELAARIGHAEDNLQILEDDLDKLQGEVTDLDGRIESLQGQADDIESQLASAKGQIADVTGDLTALQSAVNGVRDTVAAIRQRAATVDVPSLSSSTVAAPPTAGDYNALQGDVAAMRQAILNLKAAVAG